MLDRIAPLCRLFSSHQHLSLFVDVPTVNRHLSGKSSPLRSNMSGANTVPLLRHNTIVVSAISMVLWVSGHCKAMKREARSARAQREPLRNQSSSMARLQMTPGFLSLHVKRIKNHGLRHHARLLETGQGRDIANHGNDPRSDVAWHIPQTSSSHIAMHMVIIRCVLRQWL